MRSFEISNKRHHEQLSQIDNSKMIIFFSLVLFFPILHSETEWKLQALKSTELIGLLVKSNVFSLVCVCMCVCFHAHHLLVVTDSGKSQHGIRLNYRGEKGVRGGESEKSAGWA